ncbi:MAG: aldehyde dehydrogenase family protein, partial [Alphaproteobacteria bacterium]|nr:aldehyde dehydrogenase family protein [Alphaproteobacteria bacterium]
GAALAALKADTAATVGQKIAESVRAFEAWEAVPAPKRGELVRLLGETLREYKHPLAELVTLENGKILQEGLGEVQEMIDICDFALGQARQLYGKTMPSERPDHQILEYYLPLGPVGIITAFNFPVAVWAWNAALALVCGDSLLWKPSEKTPLTALATQALFEKACARFTRETGVEVPAHLSQVILGDATVSEALVTDTRVPLISATGSVRMGKRVGQLAAARMARVLLELGGNNASIVTPSANLDAALPAILFGAVGTAGQRCTTLRRLIVHKDRADAVLKALVKAYQSRFPQQIGDPAHKDTLVGPLIDRTAFDAMQKALEKAKQEGGEVLFGGGRALAETYPNAWYATPAIVRMPAQTSIVHEETFAPILYAMTYETIEEAIAMNNAVPQGLSSSIFTQDMGEANRFVHASKCGLANVNLGTSGAEIGGAFGGNFDTGWGRESGSDSWKNYVRQTTSTQNYGSKVLLAQGIVFSSE